jgi:hypothetical protein
MLSTIQDMRFYLRTGLGDSQAYASSTIGNRLRGCVKEMGRPRRAGQL